MTLHTKIAASIVLLCLCIIPGSVMAGRFDGSKELVCAAMQSAACGFGEDCISGTAEDIDFPNFIRINVKKKTISASEEYRRDVVTEIKNIERKDGVMILQGSEEGRGWSLALSETTGKMVMTASGNGEGFVVFGACTTR